LKHNLIINTIPLLSSLTGIGRYTFEISKYLEDEKVIKTYFFYGYYSKKLLQPLSKSNLRFVKSFITKSQLVKSIARKLLIKISSVLSPSYDIYWEPNFIPLENIKAKKIVTSVHDFSFILYKEFHPQERIEYFENNFYKNIVRSDKIICFTEFTKNEIINYLDIEENKIKVIPHGIDHNLFKVYKDLQVSFKLPKKFIFSVGSIEPRKNLLGLLNAYNSLKESYKKEYSLVLAGFKGWENKEIMNIIEKNKEYIHYLGYISDEELAKTYNLASLFVYPSFYEGFGLPPLEAMACGTPVVTSNVSSLPEVGGDAVIYCNPSEVVDIKEKIELVLNDKGLQKEMIIKGLERVKEFTWEKSAEDHIKVFRELLKT
jgi:glycosyltransferase involved in cell wall biosynthesis